MASWREILWGKDDKGLRLIKQLAAGAVENTVANSSETPGSYRPAIVDAPGAIGEIVSNLTGTQFKNKTARQFLENSLRRAQLATARTNKTLGTTDPQNTDELAARVTGGLINPVKEGAIANIISKAPKGAQALAVAGRIAEKTPKYLKTPTKVAAEVVMPLRQTEVRTAAPIAAAITGASDVALDQSVDPTTGVRYEGTVPKLLGVGSTTPNEQPVDPEEQALEELMYQTGIENGDINEEDAIHEAMSKPVTEEEVFQGEQEDKLEKYALAAGAVAVALGGGATLRYAGNLLDSRAAAAVDPANIGRFTGKKFKTSRGSRSDDLITGGFEQDRPIRSAAEEYLSRPHAKRIGFKLDIASNTAIQRKAMDAFTTGRLPGSRVRTEKMAQWSEAYSKELTPDEQGLVSDALNAASALDDYRATGVHSAMTKWKGNTVTPAQLEMLVQQVTSDPKLAKYYHVVQKYYDDLAKFEVDRSLMSPDQYREFRAKRPNYVPHRRNLALDSTYSPTTKVYSPNADITGEMARAVGPNEGIQEGTGIGNPFHSLFEDMATLVRRAEHNDVRGEFLFRMANSTAKDSTGRHPLIEEINPTRTSSDSNIHSIKVNGQVRRFIVRDAKLSTALSLAPRTVVPVFEEMRQVAQSTTTGPWASLFNFFGTLTSPVFEATAASMFRKPGQKIGLENRLLVGGYTGGLRYLGEDILGKMAQTTREHLIQDNSVLKRLIGDTNLQSLNTVLENAYENSTKSIMDTMGITSHNVYAPDVSRIGSGLEGIMPETASAAASALRKDIGHAYQAGDIKNFRAAAETLQSLGSNINANGLVRMFGMITEAMHNGARHTATRANIKNLRAGNIGYDQVASEIRRLTADTAKHGANPIVQAMNSVSMYTPINLQSLYELGLRVRDNPLLTTANIMTTAMLMTAMGYVGRHYFEEANQQHNDKSPVQKATSITSIGGVEIPIEPLMRPVLAPIQAIMDHLVLDENGKLNAASLQTFEKWLEGGDDSPVDEAFLKDFDIRLAKGVEDNMPVVGYNYESGNVNLQSIPIASLAIALGGGDPGMSRITGEVTPVRTQGITGFDTGANKKPDSFVSGQTEAILTSVFSTAVRSVLGIADDAYRAHVAGGSKKETLDMALKSYKDKVATLAKPIKPIFGDYPTVKGANDLNYELLKDRQTGIDQAVKVYDNNYRTPEITSMPSKFTKEAPVPDKPQPELEGTEALYIVGRAKQLDKQLAQNKRILSAAYEQIEKERALYLATPEEKNRFVNNKNDEIKYQHMDMLRQVQSMEELISRDIGRPFTFDNFDPNDYLKPMAPLPQ